MKALGGVTFGGQAIRVSHKEARYQSGWKESGGKWRLKITADFGKMEEGKGRITEQTVEGEKMKA